MPEYLVEYAAEHDLPIDYDVMEDGLAHILWNKDIWDEINRWREIYNKPPLDDPEELFKDIMPDWAQRVRDQEEDRLSSGERVARVARRVRLYDDENELEASVIPISDTLSLYWGIYTATPTYIPTDGYMPPMLVFDGGVLIVNNYDGEIFAGVPWQVHNARHLVLESPKAATMTLSLKERHATLEIIQAWAEEAAARTKLKIRKR